MNNNKIKNLVEFDYVIIFYSKLNLKPNFSINFDQDRFFTYKTILDILIENNQTDTILDLKTRLKNNENVTTIFHDMLNDDNSNLYYDLRESVEYYFDYDLITRFS